MRAAVLHAPGDLRMEEIEIPRVGCGEVLLRVKAVGICISDVARYQGLEPLPKPIVIGHEYSGMVAEVGREVKGFEVGERVCGEGWGGCGKCSMCTAGFDNLCESPRWLAVNENGAFAEYLKMPAKFLYNLPDAVSTDEAQSLLIVACCVRAIHKAEISLGSKVAILGPGHAGLILLQLSKLAGADRVVMIGTRANRLKLAQELGSDLAINIQTEDLSERLAQSGYREGFDVVIDAAGTPSAVQQAFKIVRSGGTILIFSRHWQPVDNVPVDDIVMKELRIQGTKSGPLSEAIRLVETKKVQILPLITHYLSLEAIREGLDMMLGKKEDALRIVIRP